MKKYSKYLIISALLLNITLHAAQEDVIIKMPKVPEVPKVEAVVPKVLIEYQDASAKTNDEIIKEATTKKPVRFSHNVAPVLFEKKSSDSSSTEVGDVSNGRVSAYLHTKYAEVKSVKEQLEKAGFEILSTFKVDKKGFATSIVFTNEAIKKAAAKENRGFASSLRVTVDKKNKLVSISNPIYLMKAFMQDEYNQELAQKTLVSLRENFSDLKNSTEVIKFRVLERFQFMEGMPKYNDMITIKKAKNATLLKKAKKSKKVVYQIQLANGSTVIGVKLGKRTTKFVKKTGYQNAGLLPYPVLIENGKASIMDPKYYIAVMYPMLKMSQFMTISTVPGAINKDIDRIFR